NFKHLYMRYLYIFILLSSYAMAQNGDLHNKGEMFVFPNTIISFKSNFINTNLGEFYNEGDAFFYADFINNGIYDFTNNSSLNRFVGDTTQNILGQSTSYFNDVLFQNTSSQSPFNLLSDINVYGLVDFYDGIVNNNNGALFLFREQAEHTNTSDYSHVEGPVDKIGDADFIFPVGDLGYYRYAGLSSFESLNSYQVEYFAENSDALYSHEFRSENLTLINNTEYWRIESTVSEDVMLTLSWRESVTQDEIIESPEQNDIHIVRWDTEEKKWIDEGGVVSLANQTVTTAINKLGVFTLGKIETEEELPCEVIVYNAVTPNNDGVNDFFRIDKVNNNCIKELNVKIFNRWGVKVFESSNYGEGGNVFRGFSEGRVTLNQDKQLPTGTYFYVLEHDYDTDDGVKHHKEAGYLYLNGN
ncbi:MAG: gliding motility-associated C-terminal domain-containing protein, partial [Lactococcus lactis]|nr:gliding motility-associated C-terminal domain-containing protein [Lactococcus lactis]